VFFIEREKAKYKRSEKLRNPVNTRDLLNVRPNPTIVYKLKVVVR
jgi:hypothetical protein